LTGKQFPEFSLLSNLSPTTRGRRAPASLKAPTILTESESVTSASCMNYSKQHL